MSWNPSTEVQYHNNSLPYSSIGSFVDFLEVFTYDHVNYIFADTNYIQGSTYNPPSATNTSLYKFAASEPGNFSYYEYGNGYVADNPVPNDSIRQQENPLEVADGRAVAATVSRDGNSRSTSYARHIESPRNHQGARDNAVIWQDGIDPDNMTYEELLELGETVGAQSRGLSQFQIALLPTSKFKCGLFSRKKFRGERCVICQMEYKRGDRRITLPCKHIYHTDCGNKWLSINKACPICYKDVIVDVPKR